MMAQTSDLKEEMEEDISIYSIYGITDGVGFG